MIIMNFLSPNCSLGSQNIEIGVPMIVISMRIIKDLLPIIEDRVGLEEDRLQCWLLVSQRHEIRLPVINFILLTRPSSLFAVQELPDDPAFDYPAMQEPESSSEHPCTFRAGPSPVSRHRFPLES